MKVAKGGQGGMALSRRGFLKISGAAAAGTALGGVAGLGLQPKRAHAAAQALRIQNAKAYPSVCPYCAVGCGTLVHVANGQIVNIEGNPDSPINQGNLCPKGAAIYQLHVNPNRQTKVLHRAPALLPGRRWTSTLPWIALPSWSRRPATTPSR